MNKTNAMRILDKLNITYDVVTYEVDENDLSGVHAAKLLHIPCEEMFKTLVLRDDKNELFVCCIPVAEELDLKKAAKAGNHKNAALIRVKELQSLTGYIRGGCSPIGMKKQLPTFIDETCILFDRIYISAGIRGCSLLMETRKLIDYCQAKVVELCK